MTVEILARPREMEHFRNGTFRKCGMSARPPKTEFLDNSGFCQNGGFCQFGVFVNFGGFCQKRGGFMMHVRQRVLGVKKGGFWGSKRGVVLGGCFGPPTT